MYVVPFTDQVYELQAAAVVVVVELGLMVNTNVFVAQPDTDVYVPLVVYVCPFTDHVYESQAVIVVVGVVFGVIVNTNVSVLQPVTEV